MRMELNQLRYFQKVARTKSVTKAAQELFISQPSLSQSLGRLESSLGTPLFSHQPGKSLQLNEAGWLFLKRVDAAFAELEEGVNELRQLSDQDSMQVSIASSIHDLCDDIMIDYFGLHPDVSIAQRLVEINSLTDLLLGDEVDFAISPCPLNDVRLDCRPIYTEELMGVVGPGHRLYGRPQVDRSELLDERFICNYSESDRNFLEMLFEDSGREFDIMLESNEPNVIRRMVETGLGVAFRPARLVMRRHDAHDGRREINWAFRITGYTYDTPTCISKKRERYLLRSAKTFYDFIVAYCREESRRVEAFLADYVHTAGKQRPEYGNG